MTVQALGYFGFGSKDLDDWRQFGTGLVGKLLMIDARNMRFETLNYKRDPLNILNGDALTITDLSGHK